MKHQLKRDKQQQYSEFTQQQTLPQFKAKGYNKFLEENEFRQQQLKHIEKGNEEVQVEGGIAMKTLLKQDVMIDKDMIRQTYDLAVKLLKQWSEDTINQWKKVFILTLQKIKNEALNMQALQLVIQLLEKNQPIATRKAATFLMGKICFVLESDQFVELLDDEEEEVQCWALESLKHVMDKLSPPILENLILPQIQKLLLTERQKIIEKLTDVLGEYLDKLYERQYNVQIQRDFAVFLNKSLMDLVKKENDKEHKDNVFMSFCYNLPAFSLQISEELFLHYLIPIVIKIQDYQESLYNLIVSLPQVIRNMQNDESRFELLKILHQKLDKAITDKESIVINLIVKEISVLYEDYQSTELRQQFPESFRMFSSIKKQLVSIQSLVEKDWRNYENYLNFVRKIIQYIEPQNFNKNFLQNILKNLKKQNLQNKNLIADLLIQILTKTSNNKSRQEIHQFMNYDLSQAKEMAENAYQEIISQEYRQLLQSQLRKKAELNLAAQEIALYQKEKEEIEQEKKRDIDKIMRQAKDAYFSKVNQSFTFAKQQGLSMSNQSARQGTGSLITQANDFISSGPIALGIQQNNPIKATFLSQKEENKRDMSIENVSNYSNPGNQSALNTLLPPIYRNNWENSSTNSGCYNNGGDGSTKSGTSRNVSKNGNATIYGLENYSQTSASSSNAKNLMLPIHPNTIKNRNNRKIDMISTQKSTNFKNIAISPLLNPKKYEVKKF
ncbi:UNKNOWN [Stylonychia lemnae]|uniref:Uncharacterized protein n=1 Tax=Stylonychia lemnae TaxID=5949 RepID=A0A078AN10_STYLE|nr:UNKNOWN [Stylonychia lemnae]|eukprot:CDW83544.1 UNKNOWN [Stylonychia lemnae]